MNNRLKQGETLFADGKIKEAENYFLDLVDNDPANAEILNNLGVIYYTQTNIEKAEKFFLKALAIQEDHLDSMLNLVDLYQNVKRWEEAALQLEKCITIDNQNPNLYNQLGMIYLEMDYTGKARTVLKKSLKLNTEQEAIRISLNALEPLTDIPTAPRIISRNRVPTVSVGLPVYNGGKLIGQAIESILSQDFENIELIISDNCSTDNTEQICLNYKKMDKRIRYYRLEKNLGIGPNFKNVLGLSVAPYFMWASHDDIREQAFISKCLEKIESDPLIALVYPRSKILDSNSKFLRIANDHVNADQDSGVERFRHLIWELGICNMVFGLYRTKMIKRVQTMGKSLFGDTLFLAEIALLLGKIVQIDDVLFVRRLTRGYKYRSLDDLYEQLMSLDVRSKWLLEGISLPYCRLTYAHLELINYSEIEVSKKNFLMDEILKCFKTRYGDKMKYEINRAIELINNGYFYYTWDKKQSSNWHSSDLRTNDYFHINNLVRHLREALFIFSERADLKDILEKCHAKILNFNGTRV